MRPLPEWLVWPNDLAVLQPDALATARSEMYSALSLYYEHVKHVIYIMVSVPGAVVFILNLARPPSARPIYLFAGVFLLIVPPLLGGFSIRVIRRYYGVYVAAMVFAVCAHAGARQVEMHPWLKRTADQALSSGARDSQAFIDWRSESPSDTFVGYKRIILTIAAASSIGGILLIWYGFKVAV